MTKIFEDFEDDSEDEDEEKDVGTGVVTSQLRHFVVQVLFSGYTRFFMAPYDDNRNISTGLCSSIRANDPSIHRSFQINSKDIKSDSLIFCFHNLFLTP